MSEFLQIAQQAARDAGALLLRMQDQVSVREKNPKDLVTEADVASEKIIREAVCGAFPNHAFLGEEASASGHVPDEDAEYRWIVDPLDGTTNYVHKLQTFAVSIALERRGELVVGVVYDPVMDECYHAEAGKGAFLNDEPLQTSVRTELRTSLLAASFSTGVHRDSPEVKRFIEVLVECRALRRLGSAALNCCYVAAGRLEGYWATSVSAWDVAAGALLIQEAGGVIAHMNGGPFNLADPKFIAAANPDIHQAMAELLGGE